MEFVINFKSIFGYIKFGLWHYYYRSYYAIFLSSLLISSIISYGAYMHSLGLFAMLILTLWFEEKIILLYIVYFILHDELRNLVIPYLDVNRYIDTPISFFDSFVKNINEELVTSLNEVFDKMHTSLIDNFYTYAPILLLVVLVNRVITNIFAKKIFKVNL